jgi:glutathione S-transferase
MRTYATSADQEAHHESVVRQALDTLRAALAGGRDHLVADRLSFADIAMAVSLQFILPVSDQYIELGPATRAAWTHPALAADHGDLLAWRDRLYRSCR